MTKNDEKIRLDEVELERLKEAVRGSSMPEQSKQTLLKTLGTFNDICTSLQQKKASIANLRSLLGIKTEKDSSFSRNRSLDSVFSSSCHMDQKKSLAEEEKKEFQRMLVRSWIHQSQK